MSSAHDQTRIGTSEREQAIALLSEHFSAGRLTVEEFSQRCAAVGGAVTRGELSSTVADLPRATTVGFGAHLEQVIAEKFRAEDEIAQREAAAAELQRRAAAAPAAEFQICLEQLATLLTRRVKPSRVSVSHRGEIRSSPEGFVVYSDSHTAIRDWRGTSMPTEAEVLLPDGRLWKSWYEHSYARIGEEFSEYGSVKIGPYIVHFDDSGRLYARHRNPSTFVFGDKDIDLTEALAHIATRVIKQG